MTTWQRDPAALARTSADRVVLLPGDADEPVLLSAAGAAVWRALGRQPSQHELVDELADAFGADLATVAPEVEAFLTELVALGAVRRQS